MQIGLELIQESNLLDEDVACHPDECDLSITNFIDMDNEIQETQDDSNKKVLPTRRSSILVPITILKKAMNEQDLPLYDEIQKLEQEFDKKFIQSCKQKNLKQCFLVKIG